MEKIANISFNIFRISTVLALISWLTYLFYSPFVLTSKSFEKIEFLNNEFKKLKNSNNIEYRDENKLIFDLNNILDPDVFKEYYFLNDYLHLRYMKKIYIPRIEKIKNNLIEGKSISIFKNRTYYNVDSIETDIKDITNINEFYPPSYYYDFDIIYLHKISTYELARHN